MSISYRIFDSVFGWHSNDEKDDGSRALMGGEYARLRKLKDEARAELEKLPCEKLSVTTADGLKLSGRLFTAGTGDRLAVLVHGYNSYGLREFSDVALRYLEKGYKVLLCDNRSAGESEGTFQGFGIFEREDYALWLGLMEKRFPDIKTVLHGCSMGAGTVCYMASMDLPCNVIAVISDCGFTKIEREFSYFMKRKTGIRMDFVVRTVLRSFEKHAGRSLRDFTPLDSVREAKVPVIFIHGSGDSFIPMSHSEELYENCAGRKELVIVEGAGHAQSSAKDPEKYFDAVFGFLGRIG